MSIALTEVIARVYGVPPEDFVAARAAAVAQARKDGDRNLAASIGKLRKPTVAAWLVNLLAHQRPELIAELLALGAELGRAQRGLAGAELRDLSTRRRQLVTELTRESRALAVAAGRGARDPLPLAEVEATLTAALADEAVAEEVQAGRLTRAAEYAGFGELPRPQLRLVQGRERAPAAQEPGSGAEPEPGSEAGPEGQAEPASKLNAESKQDPESKLHAESKLDPEPGEPVPAGPQRQAARTTEARRTEAARTEAERVEAARTEAERVEARRTESARAEEEQVRAQEEQARAEEAQARAEEEQARVERAREDRAEALRRRTARAAAHRELLAARTELAEAEAVRTAAERAVLAARRRVEAALARATGLDGDQIQG